MGDTLSRMADIQDRQQPGRAIGGNSRLEFIAVRLMAGMLASEEGPFTAQELAQEAVEYAQALKAALDAEGNQ